MHTLQGHLTAVRALIIRDLMVRFGRSNIGFFWTVLEPMILTAGVMLVWSMLKDPVIHGVPLIAFVVTGYMPLTLWRHLTNPLIRLLRNNSYLLYHRPLSHADIIVARMSLEFISTCAALGVIYFVVVATGLVEPMEDPTLALAGWLLTGCYYGGMGLLLGAWTEWWDPAERFIQPLQYLTLPISGVFMMVDWMPSYAQQLLLLNPSVHCFEMFRAGFFGEGITTHYDPLYLIACSAVMCVAGVAAMYHVRDRIQFN